MKKTYTKVALVLVVLVFLFAVASFLRENWGADATPGAVETFLAKLLLGHARGGENVPNPLQPTQENLQEGRQLYEKQCAFCHALDGKGQSTNGIQFYPPVPSLIDHPSEMADGQIEATINKGIRYTAMPSFAKVLSQEERWKVVLWVRRLSQQPPLPQSPGPEGAKQVQ